MDLISYGDSIPEGDYRLHSAFANAINFRKGRIIVSLVPPLTGAGPLNLVLKQLPPGAKRLRASRFYFYVDENRLRKEPEALYSSAVPSAEAVPETVEVNTEALAVLLARKAPPKSLAFIFSPPREKDFSRVFEKHLLARFKRAMAYFRAGNYARGTKTIRGLGLGLTPSGDDFLAGMLAGLHFARAALRFDTGARIEEIFFHAEGGNLISNTFLRASYEGKVNAKVRRLMVALSSGSSRELRAAAEAALQSGHTSGADFCSGLVFSLQNAFKG
ncbi:MAG TPA: hypothetical protein DCZ92_06185 [Elusimicrobia bacterium]|nr:MAG: hypothetical protein A2016_06200 [Elusimicrobia bacterium GWF2_62_30]HBA60394.1 hypothetical protein [Elusimicrobiota bacterium]